MEVGSRVMVCYATDDVNCQNPFIMGTFHRAGSGNSTGWGLYMAIKNTIDQDVTKQDVDLSYSDIPLKYESDELNQFKLKAQPSPFNIKVGGDPLKTESDEYADATRVSLT